MWCGMKEEWPSATPPQDATLDAILPHKSGYLVISTGATWALFTKPLVTMRQDTPGPE